MAGVGCAFWIEWFPLTTAELPANSRQAAHGPPALFSAAEKRVLQVTATP